MYEELKQILQNGRRMVFFGGAGVSTESGIPDFRSESGLYHARNRYGVAPEYLLSEDCFLRDPKMFFSYYMENLVPKDAVPNKAHRALARLEEQGKLAAIITQNVDGLHQTAGSKNVLELHGSIHDNRCVLCGARYALDYLRDETNWMNGIPRCSACGGTVKPRVVLYGEALDETCIRRSLEAIEAADVLIIGGTSLAVWPAAGFINDFNGEKLVLINRSATDVDREADLVIREPIGEVLGICLNLN
ncbi:MAG: NAD-dependent protein deacylase [Eubacteriales bacterium]|nr:NAD-dependent protein deacylase [Eubacteriales bacterium]MDD4286473.1 NAD-dependent protein deacylase [Eubacteriales bacterium]HPF19318.1 NAD-dependent protein deacylase [Bacillota bacterium]